MQIDLRKIKKKPHFLGLNSNKIIPVFPKKSVGNEWIVSIERINLCLMLSVVGMNISWNSVSFGIRYSTLLFHGNQFFLSKSYCISKRLFSIGGKPYAAVGFNSPDSLRLLIV